MEKGESAMSDYDSYPMNSRSYPTIGQRDIALFLVDVVICSVCVVLMQLTPTVIYGIDISRTPWVPVCELDDGTPCWSGWFLIPLAIVLSLISWRVFRYYRAKKLAPVDGLPCCCVPVVVPDGPTIYMVGTMHVSPGSPVDVKNICRKVAPDCILIELDQERWDKMQDDGKKELETEELHTIVTGTRKTIQAIPAEWNSCHEGKEYHGELIFDESLSDRASSLFVGKSFEGKIALVRRGGFPFALKTACAAKAGALALFCIDVAPEPESIEESKGFQYPFLWLPVGNILHQMRHAWRMGSCALPPVPCFLVNYSDGEELLRAMRHDKVQTNFFVRHRPDMVPHTLLRNLCQLCVIISSGVGILYGLIRCAGIEVGGEFLAANAEAKRLKKPFVLVDVSMDDLGGALRRALVPWPRNLFAAVRLWMALPRWIVRNVWFPASNMIDICGVMLWLLCRFKLRTWLAFIVSGFAAATVASFVLTVPGKAVSAGMVAAGHEASANDVEKLFPIALQLYLLPRIFEGLVNQRDEAMFQSITAEIRRRSECYVKGEVDGPAQSFVVVVGAAHVNGILSRMYQQGFHRTGRSSHALCS